MIKQSLPLLAKQEAITQPVAMSILKDIKIMLIGHTDIPVRVAYRNTDLINKNWLLNNIKRRDLHKTHNELLTASYLVTYDENIITTKLRGNDNIPLFVDSETNTNLKPVRMDATGTLDITMLFKSKGELESIVSKLRRRAITGRQQTFHTVNYLYSLNPEVIKFLKIIAKYRKHVLEIEETFIDYLNRICDERVTYVTDQSNQGELEIGFKEVLTGVLGYFTDDLIDLDISYDSGTGYWSTTFGYVYKYETVDSLELQYNSVIYNKLLPKEYRTFYSRDNELRGKMSIGQHAMMDSSYFIRQHIYENAKYKQSYIHVPKYDSHKEVKAPQGWMPIFSVLTLIDKTDKKCLFNLNDLGDFKLKDTVLDYILNYETNNLKNEFESIFKLFIYDNQGERIGVDLVIGDDLSVCSSVDLNIFETHRILFTVLTDTSKLDTPAFVRTLKNFPELNTVINILESNTNTPLEDNYETIISLDNEPYMLHRMTSSITTELITLKGD